MTDTVENHVLHFQLPAGSYMDGIENVEATPRLCNGRLATMIHPLRFDATTAQVSILCPIKLSLHSPSQIFTSSENMPRSSRVKPSKSSSSWQNLGELADLGILQNHVLDVLDVLDPADRAAARLVARSWARHLPVRHLNVKSPCEIKRTSMQPGRSPCLKSCSVSCMCKLAYFRHSLTSVTCDTISSPPDELLRALGDLPAMRRLSLSFDDAGSSLERHSGHASDEVAFPAHVESLRLYGARDYMVEQVGQLKFLSTLELRATPKFSADSHRVLDISPLMNLRGSLQSLCIEYSVGWQESCYDTLRALTGLRVLSIDGFSGRCLEAINGMRFLSKLELLHDGDLPMDLNCLRWNAIVPPPSLSSTTLEVSNCGAGVLWKLMACLRPFVKSLKSIELHCCDISLRTARILASFTCVTDLYIVRADAQEDILEALQPLRLLTSLALGGIDLTDKGLLYLHAFQLLRCLDKLAHPQTMNGGFSLDGLDSLVNALPCLEQLNLEVAVDRWSDSMSSAEAVATGALQRHVLSYSSLACTVEEDLY